MRTLYCNGDIITMENNRCEAVLISEGKIEETGSFSELQELADEVYDLEHHTLIPSFIDAHSHLTAVAQASMMAVLEGAENLEEIRQRIENFKRSKDTGSGWLIGYGYDQNELAEHRHPDRMFLDSISSEIPILLTHISGHIACMNSAGLKYFGISENSQPPAGGSYGRYDDGRLNGVLEEAAFIEISEKLPKPDIKMLMKSMSDAQDTYLSRGITTVQDGLTKRGDWQLLNTMAKAGALRTDVVSYIAAECGELAVDTICGQYKKGLRIGGRKLILDGSPQGRTAWLSEPYEGGGYGAHTYSDDEVIRFMSEAERDKCQILIHANGDAACEQMIRCAREANVSPLSRPVMIHAQLLRHEQLLRLKNLGIIPSFFVDHVFYWGDVHIKNLGQKRASGISPAGSAERDGLLFTFHQDSPVIQPDMLHTIWCAAARRTKSGKTLGRNEAVSVYQALKAVTANAAFQYFEEDKKGSIAPGKNADLVVLDKNPLKVPIDEIPNIKVLETIRCGKSVYKSN